MTGDAVAGILLYEKQTPIVRTALEQAGYIEMNSTWPGGCLWLDLCLFWLKHDVKPATRDCIMEVTLDPNTGEPVKAYNIETVWNINSTHDYRDKYGRIEYWACWCKMGRLGKE